MRENQSREMAFKREVRMTLVGRAGTTHDRILDSDSARKIGDSFAASTERLQWGNSKVTVLQTDHMMLVALMDTPYFPYGGLRFQDALTSCVASLFCICVIKDY